MNILDAVGLSFDDVLLVPRKSTISSRFSGGIDLSTVLVPGLKLKYPIISANMDTTTGYKLADTLSEAGALGIIHRFLSVEDHLQELLNVNNLYQVVLCIGVGKEQFEERFLRIFEYDNPRVNLGAVLVDIAHGHSDSMLRQIERVKSVALKLPIIAGNVATYEGTTDLLNAGVHSVKCGVGPGSVCSTRIQTGNGVPQLTAIMECRRAIDDFGDASISLIADGGIRAAGDVVKSLASGASAVMIGNLFAGTEEAIGEVISTRHGLIKAYRGMASLEAQKSWKGYATSIEGEMMNVPYKGSAKGVLNGLISGMLSGMSYQNASNLKELQENAVFIRQTSAGYRESQPHALLKE